MPGPARSPNSEDRALWLVLERSRGGALPWFRSAWLSEQEALNDLSRIHRIRDAAAEALGDDPPDRADLFVSKYAEGVRFDSDGVPADSHAHLLLRQRLARKDGIPTELRHDANAMIAGLTRESVLRPASLHEYPFVIPREFDQSKAAPCDGCREPMQLAVQVQKTVKDHKTPAIACVWICRKQGCSAAGDPHITWHGVGLVTVAEWGVPGVEWPDYPLADDSRGLFDRRYPKTKNLIGDGWKIGGHPCWLQDRPDVKCACGSVPTFCFQLTTTQHPHRVDFGDTGFVYVFRCRCGETIVLREEM